MNRQPRFLAAVGLFSLLACLIGPTPAAQAATQRYVTATGINAGDCSDSANPCRTINYAIGQAAPGDTINIAAGAYYENLMITKDLTFTGAKAVATIIHSAGIDVVVTVSQGVTAYISGVTIQDGNGNAAGGIYNNGVVTLVDSAVVQNVGIRGDYAGGIFNGFDSTLTLINSIVSHNTASSGDAGGGISNFGVLRLANSTVSDNTAGQGGGIFSNGTLVLINSTVSGNIASDSNGGGIANRGTVSIVNSTISNNTSGAGNGGGISNEGGAITLANTIMSGNAGGISPDCAGILSSQGYNLLGNNTGCTFSSSTGDLVGTAGNPIDARLGPLQNNGGMTFTQMPQSGSPAIDQGSPAPPSTGNACVITDQIGTLRPQGQRCDIGALEVFPTPAITSLSPAAATTGGVAFTLTIAGANFASGATVRWNGINRMVTPISSTQVQAQITAADIAAPGTAAVTVVNPAPGGGESNSATFAINSLSGNPTPTINRLNPAAATVGDSPFTLIIDGTDFVSGATVYWNGAFHMSTFISNSRLTAPISRADIASVGAANVIVRNPAPGGGASNTQLFTIRPAFIHVPLLMAAAPILICTLPDGESWEPANDIPRSAPLLTTIGQTCTGSFDDKPNDSVDLYRIVVGAPKSITIDLTDLPAQADDTLALYDSRLGTNYLIPPRCVSKTPGSADEHIVYPNAAPGTYYVGVFRVKLAPNASNIYRLRVNWDANPAACISPHQ
jgi:hypothetical protein